MCLFGEVLYLTLLNMKGTKMAQETKQTAQYINKMKGIGSVIANAFINVDVKAESTKREILLTHAQQHSTSGEGVAFILDGFVAKFESEGYNSNVIKQRKAEANAVFKAVALTAVTGENFKLMKAHIGGYHSFIQLARELNAGTNGEAPPGTRQHSERPLTDNQMAKVSDSLKKADTSQLTQVADRVVNELNKAEQPPELAQLSQFTLIANIARSIQNNESFDKISREVAGSMFRTANLQINRLEKAQSKANEMLNDIIATRAAA